MTRIGVLRSGVLATPVIKDSLHKSKSILNHFSFIMIQRRVLVEHFNHEGRSPHILRYF